MGGGGRLHRFRILLLSRLGILSSILIQVGIVFPSLAGRVGFSRLAALVFSSGFFSSSMFRLLRRLGVYSERLFWLSALFFVRFVDFRY